jgi:hypothetical protein
MAYKVKKTVTEGDFFIEHRCQKFPETFEGKWKKVGVFIESNPSAFIFFSDFQKSKTYLGNHWSDLDDLFGVCA